MRRAARRDDNEGALVQAIEAAGWAVFRVSDEGLPDLFVVRRGECRWIEVKGAKGKLTPAQEKVHARLKANGFSVFVVRTVDEALAAVKGGGHG